MLGRATRFAFRDPKMPHAQRHRGAHPEDAKLFGAAVLPKLRAASDEVSWLLGRGYRLEPALRAVGEHHQLDARQRLAIQRTACSPQAAESRRRKRLDAEGAAAGPWQIDGFNLIISLEVALSGGLLLRGGDGALRDLAGLRGSYHPVTETEDALVLLGAALTRYRAPAVQLWLDAPVANSGRLRARILEHAAAWPCPVVVELVPDADRALQGAERVVSGDSVVLDACASWLNLAAWLVAEHLPRAWLLDLGPAGSGP